MTRYEEIIHDEIIDYFVNCETRFNDEAKSIVNSYDDDWWVVVDTDNEEEFLKEIIDKLLDCDDIWKNNYVFSYINKTENYSEYDGFIENAPDEETAWDLFLSYSGEFGIADPAEYLCTEIENKGE